MEEEATDGCPPRAAAPTTATAASPRPGQARHASPSPAWQAARVVVLSLINIGSSRGRGETGATLVELPKPLGIVPGLEHSTPRQQILLRRLDVFEVRDDGFALQARKQNELTPLVGLQLAGGRSQRRG